MAGLIQEKERLSIQFKTEFDNSVALAGWDDLAAGLIGQSVKDHAAALSNSEFKTTLEELSADIGERIVYLENVKAKQVLLAG